MKLKALIAGIAGTLMMATAASAADIQVVVPAAPPVVVVPAAPSFDWAGVYVGVAVAGPFEGLMPDAHVGFNIVRGNFLFGAEARVGTIAFQAITLGGAARAGVLLGQQDRLLAYGSVNALLIVNGPLLVGGNAGVEFGIGERLSVFGEAGIFGAPGNGCCGLMFRGGVNFHL